MFYLTHLYLSGDCPYTMAGNFITKVQPNWDYSKHNEAYLHGINQCLYINDFTKNHPIILRSQKRFKKNSKLSNKALVIFFDHFLAANWDNYSDISLEEFAGNTYQTLVDHCLVFPHKLNSIFPEMVKKNWLVQFKTLQGTNNVVKQLGRLTYSAWNMDYFMEDFMNDYSAFKNDFEEFFPLLINHVNSAENASNNIIIELNPELGDDSTKLKREESLRLKLA